MLNPAEAQAGPLPTQDWDALFDAVGSRLLASAESVGDGDSQAHERGWLRTQVMECVAALKQLQTQAVQERGQLQQLSRQLAQAEAALAWAHHELATTRAGEREALHQAQHDGLTRLPNRDGFRRRLNDELTLAQTRATADRRAPAPVPAPALAVLYLDLDGLKPINDTHGHHAGDQLLRIVATRLARSVRREDMVCRMGGDEFACLLTKVLNRSQLSHLACKLFDAVSAPLKIGELELTVRPSIGIAVCPTDGATADGLLRNADTAMYHAKRRQLGYAFFDATHETPPHRAAEAPRHSPSA